ncbi:MAG: hypothetical protein JW837_17710 [Sedimentisphaerales bacterium]|nr:hypothetical protein [Sedimentisphaerales bacterium]
MLILRLKQAESAIADNRLDEAFEILQSDDIRQHRRGQKLIGKLARAFSKRGQENLKSERLQLALIDCNKAEKLAGNTSDVAKLRSDICSEMEQNRLRHQRRSFKVAQARQSIENGWISVGEQILDDTSDKDDQVNMVLQQAAIARLQIDKAATKAEQALKRDDLDCAISIILSAEVFNNQSEKITELVSKLRMLANKRIKENINNGRIDLAYSLWQKILPLANGNSELSELGLALTQCRQAADYVATGQPRAAIALLRKMQAICPAAKWLSTVTDQTKKTAELLDELSASPLGFAITDGDQAIEHFDEDSQQALKSSMNSKSQAISGNIKTANQPDSSIPSKFLLQIDGVGSFLVIRDGRITVGPVSSSAQPMVGLVADPNLPVLTFERTEDDYFVRSNSLFSVNDEGTNNKLLVDGDHIAFSPRCRMKFHIPNPASTTATLSLSSGKLGRADIRRIILMDRDILIGPTSGSHINAEFLDESIMLCIQNGRFVCKTKEKMLVDNKPMSSSTSLPIKKQIRIGQLSMVLTELKE